MQFTLILLRPPRTVRVGANFTEKVPPKFPTAAMDNNTNQPAI